MSDHASGRWGGCRSRAICYSLRVHGEVSFAKELTMKSEPMVRREVLKRCGGGALALVAPSLAAPGARARSASPEREAIRTGGRRTLAEDIARWLAELRYEDLPANVVA